MICFGVYYKTGRVDNKFFIKNEETLRVKHLEGALKKRGPRQVPPKHTNASRLLQT